MRHIEFLVEDRSTEKALQILIPKIIDGSNITFDIRVFGSKQALLKKLLGRLKGYRKSFSENYGIIILVDNDNDSCKKLKAQLEDIVRQAGFTTKSQARKGQRFQVVNRIAIEELEAWFFGDFDAVVQAYPKLSLHLTDKEAYRDPDAIHRTWEALERELQKKGYFQAGLSKVEAAQKIAPHMVPAHNTSHSFRMFLQGIHSLIEQ